jgi:hypothetical protein
MQHPRALSRTLILATTATLLSACSSDQRTIPPTVSIVSPTPIPSLPPESFSAGRLTLAGSDRRPDHASYDCVAANIAKDINRSAQFEVSFVDADAERKPLGLLRLALLEKALHAPHDVSAWFNRDELILDFVGTHPLIDPKYFSPCSSAGEVIAYTPTLVAPRPVAGAIVGKGRMYVFVYDKRLYSWDPDPAATLVIPIRVDLHRQ